MIGVWDIERVDGSIVDLFADDDEEGTKKKHLISNQENWFAYLTIEHIDWRIFVYSSFTRKTKNQILFTQICHPDEEANKEWR